MKKLLGIVVLGLILSSTAIANQSSKSPFIPDDVYDLTLKRFPITVAGIDRIEKASGIQYPVAYVEPSLVVSSSDPNSYEYGILFARTIPVMFEEKFQVVIQIELL